MWADQQLRNAIWAIFDPPPLPFVTLFNVTLTKFRKASLDPPPPSKRHVIIERPHVCIPQKSHS